MTVSAPTRILICQGTGGVSAGGRKVEAEFRRLIAERGLDAAVGKRCEVLKTGCRGLCANDVLVDVVSPAGEVVTYDFVKPEDVPRIVEEHLLGGEAVAEKRAGEFYRKFVDAQTRVVMTGCGHIDPESLPAYLGEDGFLAIEKAVRTMTPAQVIAEVKKAGLRGRGGGGFPTGLKWEFAAKSPGKEKYVICNADEGDPGAFMDRSVLEGDPYCVIEGMMVAAYAIGASHGYVYVRAEYPLAVERLRKAIDTCYREGYLGKDIRGWGFDFDLVIKMGAGAFVCGEETALMASIEGERGMPRSRPPFPAVKGLWGKPTNINNVETFANVRHIINRGADWYAGIGTATTRGTKIFAVTGKVKHTGLVEVPAGMTMREVIFGVCGGILDDRPFKAVQAGGPSGGCIPGEILDTPVDYDSLIKAGAMMGSGGLVVMDDTTCMVDVARFFLAFTAAESCGKCVPCRLGTRTMLTLLEKITEGRGEEQDLADLESLARTIRAASLCALGGTAPNPVLSTLRYFRAEYEAHIRDHRCPAGVCKKLLTYTIDPAQCTGCTACVKACPVAAISGERKQPHRLDQALCIKCGACYETCRFAAVRKE